MVRWYARLTHRVYPAYTSRHIRSGGINFPDISPLSRTLSLAIIGKPLSRETIASNAMGILTSLAAIRVMTSYAQGIRME